MSFFERIVALILGTGDPEREKRRQLKLIGKMLAKDSYRFYKPRGNEIQPQFARFLYEIYRVVSPVQQLVQPSDASGILKNVVIETRLTDRQVALKERLDEKGIRDLAKGKDIKDVAESVRESLLSFVASFDAVRTAEINQVYNHLRSFVAFCHFDYYFNLKKFDSAITENAFVYKPQFDSIAAQYMTDDIKDFLELALALPREADWGAVFDVIGTFRGVTAIDRDAWRKVQKTLDDVLSSGVLERIVQHASEDPLWVPKPATQAARIVDPYVTEIKSACEAAIQKLLSERRNTKIEQLVRQVFGTTVVTRSKNYTDRANIMFNKKQLGGFVHTDAINYLKAYLLDFFKKDVREIVQDLMIVRGKWVTNVQAQQLSDAYHAVMSVADQVVKFDDSLAEEGERGQKVRKAMGRIVERDLSTTRALAEILNDINAEAQRMVNEGGQNLIIIGKNLKLLLADVERKEPELIVNWRELDNAIEDDLKDRLSDMYRRIYYLVQLLQVYMKNPNVNMPATDAPSE